MTPLAFIAVTHALQRWEENRQRFAEEVPEDGDTFVLVRCLACGQVHYVNPATGRVLGSDEEEG